MFGRALLSSLLLITWACTKQQTARQTPPAGANASPRGVPSSAAIQERLKSVVHNGD